MCRQALDNQAGQVAAAHVGERLSIDHIVVIAGAQQVEKVAAALGCRRAKPGEAVVADLRAEAVLRLVARPGVVDRKPRRAREPGAQHVASFSEKGLLPGGQLPYQLTLGYRQPEVAQLCHQPRHRYLPLMVLRQHKASQIRAEMSGVKWTPPAGPLVPGY